MAKRKPAKRKSVTATHEKPSTREFYLPQEISEFAGIPAESLRDWRRRGMIDGFGAILLPDGSTTSDPDHPVVLKLSRPQWTYSLGDMTALAIARHLNASLGLDLKFALHLAADINPKVLAWIPGAFSAATAKRYREPRFVIAWPSDRGDNPSGVPIGQMARIAVSDLNRITAYAGALSVCIDCKELASELPQALREHVAERPRDE
jgi:hypothetical protein